ncbi:HD domain-containing protein [Corticicoccus populi]|uniref:HD domain-containing protein n=1 Tax=Corticicoccus populi TaxID=1812821 RepID=A0ABW5WVR7_9STAP
MNIIEETKDFVEKRLSGEGTGHDWLHIERVYHNSLILIDETEESVDKTVVELASLLHDIADWKFTGGDEKAGPRIASDWLKSLSVDPAVIGHVCDIIQDISFKGAGVKTPMKTLEGEIVQDADRLDAIGAVGIARTFAYGGYKGQELYNPLIEPKNHQSQEAYKKQDTTSMNHFYEKLLLLKDRMNTPAGKKRAEERHQYMVEFLEMFFKENGYENSIHNTLLKNYK